MGIIGTSWWVDEMYRPSLASHEGATIAAVCGRDPERTAAMAARCGGAFAFTDYRDLIAADLDAVVVAVPDELHPDATLAALAAGRHVLCEKPLANRAADAWAMHAKAAEAGVVNMVLFTWRWQPVWRHVHALVADGFVGRPERARFSFTGNYARGPGVQWRFDGGRAHGALGDLGSHMVDFVRWNLGEIAWVSATLRAFAGREPIAGAPPANDDAVLTLGLTDGAIAEVHVGASTPVGDAEMMIRAEVSGDAGTILAEQVLMGPGAGSRVSGIGAGMASFADLPIPADYMEGIADPRAWTAPYLSQPAGPRHFVDAILAGSAATPDFHDGAKAQEVVDAALVSEAEGRRVAVGGAAKGG